MKTLLLAIISVGLQAFAQFGQAGSVQQITGAPPASQCTSANAVGQIRAQKNGAAANSTLWVCSNTAPSTYAWALVGAGGGGSGLTYTPTRTSSTILTLPAIAANSIRFGTTFCDAIASSTFTVTSGTGTVWAAVTPGTGTTCVVVARHDIVGTCSANCTAVASSTGFLPVDYPLYEWAVSGASLASTGTNRVNVNAAFPQAAGANMTQTCDSSGLCTWAATTDAYDPIDSTRDIVIDDFPATKAGAGMLGWTLRGSGAAADPIVGEANHPGLVRLTSTAGNSSGIDLVSSGSISFFRDPFTETNWERVVVFRGNTASATINAGFYSSASFVDYITIGGTPGTGNWTFYFCSASCGAATSVSSGVAATTSSWNKFRLRSLVSGTILASVSVNGGAYSTEKSLCASGCDASGTVPVVSMSPFFYTYNAGAGTTLDVDYFRSDLEGLTR